MTLAALYEAKKAVEQVLSASSRHRTGGAMPERDIFVTEEDARKLRTLLAGVRERTVRDREHLQLLDDELARAHVVPGARSRRTSSR